VLKTQRPHRLRPRTVWQKKRHSCSTWRRFRPSRCRACSDMGRLRGSGHSERGGAEPARWEWWSRL
jgi:hypothetical protein